MAAPCLWCDRPAIRYCDAPIGWLATHLQRAGPSLTAPLAPCVGSGPDGHPVMYTCDAALCAEHTKQVGYVSGSQPDSIDYCPHHVANPGTHRCEPLLLDGEHEQVRREIHAAVRRGRMAVVR